MPRIGAGEESRPWERSKIGETIGDRLGNIYQDSADWRQRAGYEKSYESLRQQRVFNQQLATWGKHVLQMQTVDEYEGDEKKTKRVVQEEVQKGHEARGRLRRKKVRVADLEDDDNNLSLKLDKEWSTAGWPKEDVEDAVSVMFEIFYAAAHSTEESKKLACSMLVKLVNRHDEAMEYVRQNIGQLAGLAASRFIRGGKSAGVLDLLHIVNACKEKFIFELSECMFTARAHDMIAIEMRLAAMLIQHMVRSHQLFKKRERRVVNPVTKEFGNDEDFMRDQMRNIVARRADLKARWRSMHAFMKSHETTTNIGLRAPSYLRREFTSICLEITQELVSDRAGKYANSNREDVLRAQGPIFYTQVLGTCIGPFVSRSLTILAQVSKMPESLAALLHSGCVHSTLKYMQFMLDTDKSDFVTSLRTGHPSTWNESEEVLDQKNAYKMAFFDCMQILANLASHAAGVHRADRGYNYARTCPIIKEDIDYIELRRDSSVQYTGKLWKVPLLHESYINALFCSERCLGMLSMLIRETTNLNVARNALRAFYGLCCSAGMRLVIQELIMEGGRTLARILELVEEADATVSSLCLSLLLQATTMDYARSQLFYARISLLLSPYLAPTQNYHRHAYQRYALIAASLLRQQNWRAYEPVGTARVFADSAEGVRVSVYLDLLKTIKNVPVSDTLESEHLTVADLVILSVHEENSKDLAVVAEELGARAIADFVSHPHDGDFFVSLDWAESVAGCQILEALCCGHAGTMQDVYSVGLAHYLGKCLHLSRYLFDPTKPQLKERMLILVLNGVRSAANALAAICKHIHYRQEEQEAIIQGVRHSDVLGAAQFFVASLTAEQHVLDAPLVRLQQSTGMSVASFYTEYLRMLETLPDSDSTTTATIAALKEDPKLGREAPRKVSKRKEELMRELEPMGAMAVKQVRGLVGTLGAGSTAREILDALCKFLVELVRPAVFSDKAIYQWHIYEALEKNLPRPLAAVGDPELDDPKYVQGLGYLPVSLLDLATTLNQLDQGALHTLNHGFLRRALEKLRLLALKQVLMSVDTTPEERLEHRHHAAGCLRLIASVGTFSKQAGGSANNVILMDKYCVVETCKAILSCPQDYKDGGFKCDEPIVTAALAALGRLSEDTFLVKEVFEKYDILGEAGRQMTQVGLMPLQGVVHCLEIVYNISTITSDYVTRRLPDLETPIQKVNRIHPELNQVVIDLTWKIAVRLNSFDDSHVEVGSNQVFHHKDFYAETEEAHQRLFKMDRILARRLEKIYDEADIPQSAREIEADSGQFKMSAAERRKEEKRKIEYVSPLASPVLLKDSREWHNPDYDTAKIISSPVEVRDANFRVDSAIRHGDEQSLGTAHTEESPFTVDEFQASSIADAHRDSPDAAMKYLMTYPVSYSFSSPTPSPAAPHPRSSDLGSSVSIASPLSGHSTPSAMSSLPSTVGGVVEAVGSPDKITQSLSGFDLSPGGSTPSVFSDPDQTSTSSVIELPPLDSPASLQSHSSASPSHSHSHQSRSLPSSPSKSSPKINLNSSFGALPSPTSGTSSPKKGKKGKGKGKGSSNDVNATVVAMDIDEAPDLVHTRPTKGGFIFTA